MFDKWFAVSPTEIFPILLSALIAYAAVLFYSRVVGLRSFSKMSAADFVMTIACGSILGATISAPTPTALAGSFALFCLFVAQWAIVIARRKSDRFSKTVDNQLVLLMAGSLLSWKKTYSDQTSHTMTCTPNSAKQTCSTSTTSRQSSLKAPETSRSYTAATKKSSNRKCSGTLSIATVCS